MNVNEKEMIEQIFSNIEKYIPTAVIKLNNIGLVTELDICTSKVILKKYHSHFENYFRNHGYSGGELYPTAAEVKGEGWIHALFDIEKLDYKEAKSLIVETTETLNN